MKKTLYVFALACFSLLALSAAAQVPGYVPTDGLVGWWPFNGNANDESGNGNDGVVNGATLTEDRNGMMGSAYDFNNTGEFINIGNSPIIRRYAEDFTISAWIKPSEFSSLYDQSILSNRTTLNQGSKFGIGGAFSNSMGKLQFGVNGGGSADWVNSQNEVSLNSWTHVVAKYEFVGSNNNIISLYINGQLANEDTIITDTPDPGNENSYFGFEPYSDAELTSQFFGLLDDIAIYNRALNEQEIQNLYTSTTPAPCAALPTNLQEGLVGYWPFCGNANDESGNGNDGTVNGATLTEDRFGNANAAYSFDGSSIVVSDAAAIGSELTSNFSMNSWITIEGFPSGFVPIISKDGPTYHQYELFLEPQSIGFWSTNIYDSAPTAPFDSSSWYMITLTFSEGTANYYVDGNLIVSQAVGNSTMASSNANLEFGADSPNGIQYHYGNIDDIGIWNRALTPEEVQELYTLDACTFTVYDTSYVTVYDTLTTYETVYDTLYTYETIYDTVTTYVTVTDTLLIDITFVGFEGQPSWLNTVTIFPNPASDHITIDYGNFALMAGYNTVITDAAGTTVYSSAVNSQQAYIDINAWGAAGVYYMTIYDASGAAVAVRHIVLE